MLNNDLNFLGNVCIMQFNILGNLTLCGNRFQFWIVLNSLINFKISLIGHIVLQHIQNEAFLNCLLHGIQVKGNLFSFFVQTAKQLQGSRFRSCGKGNHGNIGLLSATGNFVLDNIAHRFFFF